MPRRFGHGRERGSRLGPRTERDEGRDLVPGARAGAFGPPVCFGGGDRVRALEQGVEGVAVESLMLHEEGGDPAERFHVHQQGRAGLGVGLVEERADRAGGGRLDLGRERAVRADHEEAQRTAAGGARVLRLGIAAHAPLGDHGRRDLVGLVEVVRRATRHFMEQQFLCGAARP